MTKKFEEPYQSYPFAPLVRFGTLAASYVVSVLRDRKATSDRAISVLDQGRIERDTARGEPQSIPANEETESLNEAA